jgi:membrane protease YdiL (CAAX protease family)
MNDRREYFEKNELTGHPVSVRNAMMDMAIVMIAMVVVKQSLLPITIIFAGPISLLTGVILASWRLWSRGERWFDLGLRKPESILKTIALSMLVIAGIFAAIFISANFSREVLGILPPAGSGVNRFGDLEGNLFLFLGWLTLSWVHAGFNEEIIYRAFLISGFEKVFSETGHKWAIVFAIISAALFFGYRHMYYQGWYGFTVTGTIGLFLGVMYFWFGRRNIWPLVIAHGFIDSIGMVARFLGSEG